MNTLRFLLPAAACALACVLAAPPAAADPVRFSEIVTDPQQDHSENAGGNGVPYDDVPGSGTVSSIDEYVEIFHAGTVPFDLTGVRLEFTDTTPTAYVFGQSTGGVLRFSPGSTVSAFQPGAFALLGNPPGVVNNAVTLALRGGDGALLDEWVVADANAAGIDDEALHRFGAGEAAGVATPLAGAPFEPVPEPGTLVLTGLSLLLVGATARRARRGRPRRSPAAPGRAASRSRDGAGVA